jgi:DNA-directed RNA polymerase specialized sigma24 family protein
LQQNRSERRLFDVSALVHGEERSLAPGGAAETSDFDDWVAARGPGLLRLAYVLTGNRADAEDAVQDALARALPRWEHIRSVGDPDAYVRRMVVNAHTSWWRKFRRRETPVAEAHGSRASADPGSTSAIASGVRAWLCPNPSASPWCCATTNSSSTPRSPP